MKRTRASGTRVHFALTNLLTIALLGCGATQRSMAPDAQRVRKPFRDVQVNPKAEAVDRKCDYNTWERCNAFDDDCNGVIDDECGYETGEVQVTVAWDSGADIDLYVTDPSGSTLYNNQLHRRSPIGGHLDHDARGNCGPKHENSRIANAYWPPPARSGPYRVELGYISPCAQSATTEATLSVMVDGELLGAYRYRLEPAQRIEALRFFKR